MAQEFSSSDAASSPEDSLEDALRLSLIPGVGPRLRQTLLEYFGSARAALAAPPSQLRQVPGVGAKLCQKITVEAKDLDVRGELQRCEENQIHLVRDTAPDYPRLLKEIHDPPGILYVRGTLTADDGVAVAIVGSRHATPYGKQVAEKLASGLVRAGLTVVSGLARGIDTAAHRGALDAGGRTIAVLGSGLLNVYPPENQGLADQITASGAVISEQPSTAKPLSGAFPQRNRIISGLSLGVIVVEAAERSGAIISTTHATEQGREVFAVPGRVDSRMSRGCHRLIRDGAKLVETVDDVLEELGPLVEAMPRDDGRVIRHPAELQLNQQEQNVLAAIDVEPTSIDDVVASSGLPAHRVLSTISVLEMRKLIRRISGNYVARS